MTYNNNRKTFTKNEQTETMHLPKISFIETILYDVVMINEE